MNTPGPIHRNDVLLAAGCGILQATALTLGYGSLPRENYAALVCLVGAQGLALVLWRRHPVVCQFLVWGAQLAVLLLMPRGATFVGVAQVIAGFGIGLRLPPLRGGLLVGVLGLAEVVVVAVRESPDPGRWAEGVTFVLGKLSSYLLPVLGGVMLDSRTQRMQQQRDWEAREHRHQLALALIDERRRIAGELHDVAAHHLAGIVVQSAAVGRLIDRDPGAAKEAAAQLRAQSKETLDGLRSVVGLLRENATPVAGLRDLPELISTTRDLGVEVSFIPPFPRPALSPIVDMAVYRVVQQAISNALQHAPGAWLRIEVTQTGDQLETTIVNGSAQRHGESRTGGVGLKVMRERAVAAGGTLETGPTPEGGWRVRLVVPVIGGEDEEER